MVILRTITTNNAQWQHLIKVMTHYGFEESWAPKMFREKKNYQQMLCIFTLQPPCRFNETHTLSYLFVFNTIVSHKTPNITELEN